MNLIPGQIIKNLAPSEPVRINKITRLGNMTSIYFTGINSNISNNKMVPNGMLPELEVITKLYGLKLNQEVCNIFYLKKSGKNTIKVKIVH